MAKIIELVPESIRTEVVQHREPSLSGLPRRMMVIIGDDYDAENRYVLLGSTRAVENWTRGYGDKRGEHYTVEALFRNKEHLLADSLLAEVHNQQPRLDRLANRFPAEERGHLAEGIFAVSSRPRSLSEVVEGVIGLWVPIEVAFGNDWTIRDLEQPVAQSVSPALQNWFDIRQVTEGFRPGQK